MDNWNITRLVSETHQAIISVLITMINLNTYTIIYYKLRNITCEIFWLSGNESDLYTDGNKKMHDFMDKINISMEDLGIAPIPSCSGAGPGENGNPTKSRKI